MTLYHACVALHLLAMVTWLGHMFIWSLVTGPSTKSQQPATDAVTLREASLSTGGIGWPALVILATTGAYLLAYRGITFNALINGAAFIGPLGQALALKLCAVVAMLLYQSIYAHRPARLAVHLNILASLLIIGCSVILVRGIA
jgi:uncharacterized membrane protein